MDVGNAVVGGLVGGGLMIALLYMGILMMPAQMKMNLLLLIGTMVVPVGAAAYVVGLMGHAMMSVAFGIVHGAILEALDVTSSGEGLWVGALLGLGHAMVVGVALGMMPMVHPRLRTASRQGEDLLEAPGFFGMSYPLPTVIGLFMLHALFGLIVGVIYS